ncbi:MAG: hypothetical protein KBT36_04950 [Kurthia sp.]|nr:hypothetical protein [Candidatus Kurthia equi]
MAQNNKKVKKKANPFISGMFFVIVMAWLFYSGDKMSIWLSGFVALLLTAAFVVVTIVMDRRKINK